MNDYPKMRRIGNQLEAEVAYKILDASTYGVLSLCGSDNIPYAVALSHVRQDDCLYFHCATEGFKLKLIEENSNCSFLVVDRAELDEKNATMKYSSVIVFGEISIVSNKEDKFKAYEVFNKKFMKSYLEEAKKVTNKYIDHSHILKIKIKHTTGKST